MKNFGLFYCATNNVFDRLSSSLEKQKYFPADASNASSFLVTDCAIEKIPEHVRASFDKIITCDPWVLIGERRFFSLSILRNTSINAAIEMNLSGILFCDSGTIIVDFDVSKSIDFAIPNVYWQKSSEETIEQSLDNIQSEESPFSNGNSWFYLSRKMFSEYRFNEKIIGYGYEDIEFWTRVAVKCELKTGMGTIVHNFHSHQERMIDPVLFDRNRFICECTQKAISQGLSITHQNVSAYHAVHPHWENDIILIHEDSRFYRLNARDGGKFVMKKDCSITLVWDNKQWNEESFDIQGGILEYSPTND